MKKIMFNDRYGLTQAVLEGRKTQTRRIAYIGSLPRLDFGICVKPKNFGRATFSYGGVNISHSRYCIGEEVAVAQAYSEFVSEAGFNEAEINKLRISKGWTNKMFVKADLMPHRIRITDIRAERLQEISDEDCIAEGIREQYFYSGEEEPEFEGYSYYAKNVLKPLFCTPREAYAALIDKISGKGTWASNPYVFVYEFELIK